VARGSVICSLLMEVLVADGTFWMAIWGGGCVVHG